MAKRVRNQSDSGLMLLNSSLRPVYINASAAQILLHPDRPQCTKDLPEVLASKVRTMIAHDGPGGAVSVCHEFRSGHRLYLCRLFDLELPGSHSHGSSLAILLERRPASSLDIHTIRREYGLTSREGEAVEGLLQGLASKEIAARMKISPNTVKVFLRLAMLKMGATSRSAIMSRFINLQTEPV